MASSRFRKINRAVHRDLGYFFTGVVIIYGISGLAVNHVDQWNPNFIVSRHAVELPLPQSRNLVTTKHVQEAVSSLNDKGQLRSYDFPSDTRIKLYFDDGSIMANLETGQGSYETIRRRPVLNQLNFLHLHPAGWWLIFADIFAGSLVLIALTGLLVLSGRKGFNGRGKWIAGGGMLVPLLALFMT